MRRACASCRREITACNGFIVARDHVAMWAGDLRADQVRELCGICADKLGDLGDLSQDDLDAAVRSLPHPEVRHDP